MSYGAVTQYLKSAVRYIFSVSCLFLISCIHGGDSGSIFSQGGAGLKGKAEVLGTWWWDVPTDERDTHLDFAVRNGINEIYFHTLVFNESVGTFIEKAGEKGVRVFLLLDDLNYIWERPSFEAVMTRYIAYQNKAPENRRFSGLHLDIEPHLAPEFPDYERDYLQDFLNFVLWICSAYQSRPGFDSPVGTIDLDIATWYDHKLDYRGSQIEFYKALIIEADRVFIMSYKDSAEATYETARPELEFAKSLNKQIVLGTETGRVVETPEDSFYEEGRAYFHQEIRKLHRLIDYDNYGLSIHHMSAWYSLAD